MIVDKTCAFKEVFEILPRWRDYDIRLWTCADHWSIYDVHYWAREWKLEGMTHVEMLWYYTEMNETERLNIKTEVLVMKKWFLLANCEDFQDMKHVKYNNPTKWSKLRSLSKEKWQSVFREIKKSLRQTGMRKDLTIGPRHKYLKERTDTEITIKPFDHTKVIPSLLEYIKERKRKTWHPRKHRSTGTLSHR